VCLVEQGRKLEVMVGQKTSDYPVWTEHARSLRYPVEAHGMGLSMPQMQNYGTQEVRIPALAIAGLK
jgi:hypothetical protein